MLAALFTTLAYVVCAPAGTLVLSDAARVYVRDAQLDEAAAMDVENAPRLDLSLAFPTFVLSAAYEPRLAWMDVLGPQTPPTLLLHSGLLGASLSRRRYTLSLTQSASLGSQDFTTALSTGLDGVESMEAGADDSTPPSVDLLPEAEVVDIAAAETALAMRYLWSRRWSSELEASLGFSGGADAAARRFVPRQRTGRLSGSLIFSHTRRDDLGTTLSAERIQMSNGYDHWLASLEESWATRWTTSSRSEIGMGAALQDSTAPDGSHRTTWVPLGSARLMHVVPMRQVSASFEASVAYSPDLNLIVGTLQRRVHGALQAALASERTSLTLLLGAAQTIPASEPDSARVISADLILDRELLEWLDFQVGGQITRQRVGDGASAASSSAWLLHAGLVGRAPALRF